MYNRIILIGYLTREPELRYTPNGTPITNLRIAVNTKYKQGDEIKDDVLFIDVVVIGKQAEVCDRYLSKGKQILVEGKLQLKKWESDGQKKSKYEVIAQNIKFIGKKEEQENSSTHDESEEEPF